MTGVAIPTRIMHNPPIEHTIERGQEGEEGKNRWSTTHDQPKRAKFMMSSNTQLLVLLPLILFPACGTFITNRLQDAHECVI